MHVYRRANGEVVDKMFGFATPGGTEHADPLVNVAAVDDFWRTLPRLDPVRAEKVISNALADFGVGDDPSVDRLRALLVLDRRARKLADALLVDYVDPSGIAQTLERRYWQSARELAQGFGRAYGQIIRQLEHDVLPRAARDYAPVFLLRLFQHSQVEFLLRPFDAGYADPALWSELHEAYQYAHSQRILTVPQEIRRCHDNATAETTIEREYVHLLLLDLMNDGHFSPYDAFWVNRWIPRCCPALSLKSVRPPGDGKSAASQFVVDLDSAEGLVRAPSSSAVRCLYLDPAPLLATIDRDLAAPAAEREGHSTFGVGGRLKVLRKLRTVYSPKPPRVNRRGERKPVAVVVQAVVGFHNVVRMLRSAQRRAAAIVDPAVVPEVEEITITVTGAVLESTTVTGPDGERRVSPPPVADAPVPHLMWEIRDRSESGCRLHGKASSMNGIAPGTLIAMREHEMAPWILVVVRRRGKPTGDRVDLGVEFVGKGPRRVISTPGNGDDRSVEGETKLGGRRFAVLYLSESGRQPTLPFKTLIMPTSEFEPNRCVTLRSGRFRHTVRLKEPIEEQGDFTWLPFEVVERRELAPVA
jgi:hypothetical protein